MIEPQVATNYYPEDIAAENHVLACCIADPDAIGKCVEAKLPPQAFANQASRLIYETLVEMHAEGMPIDLTVLYQQLTKTERLRQVGGMAYLVQISEAATFRFNHFFKSLLQVYWRRKAIQELRARVEQIAGFTGSSEQDFTELQSSVASSVKAVADEYSSHRKPVTPARGLMDFGFIPPGHPSILLGNRYINRGDAMIYASQSGMGKSSLMLQMAMMWSLGLSFFGIRPNGKLRALIFQAEDSDGDINEVQESIAHELKLTPEQRAEVNSSVMVISERLSIGEKFCEQLALHVREFKPDLVFINPLLSYIGGDVSDAEDAAKFLREGLNGVNAKSEFAYIIAHHTSKPPKEKIDKKWSDQQYDMHGSADLTNYARAIMVLQATDVKGEFTLKLAKRGTRAGVTKPSGSAGQFEEIVTEIPLKHSGGTVNIQGHVINKIFWEPREAKAGENESTAAEGRKSIYTLSMFIDKIPGPKDKSKGVNQLAKEIEMYCGISRTQFRRIIYAAARDGMIDRIEDERFGVVFRRKT